ncbi:ThiF family adenylyltransferase [Staphylococcus massiliensis]|uniref:Putative molybdopterin biosynthesis protein moeB n=1 Tax=Staphylococcus massiliensis S46 TaxID=1229783 RepID=K9ASD8_9STAP|nr:ThiF family adenylyltransferase [Staphylococcus massiliensis]EKU48951.1 putative molybdopterin biosynthesis protein moeB [Staphylococcus massiliensis S46]MCG3399391.1 ThiF family adenylyltransferase [Staphylococcus massiliensis]MCG3411527.1 ThiF family adenylyltransferase [Staphylococcus massiliensis]PNZ98767.1 molybdopterin biosynthesis protein MoeB [Staphylococcus massiliensis CCUG 55927]
MNQSRYSRQVLFKAINQEGQARIMSKSVAIIGMGALGTHVAEGLTRSGVKRIVMVDRDYIETSNLQRQTLFTEEQASNGIPKVVAAKEKLTEIRHDIEIEAFIEHATPSFLEKHLQKVDLIIDATDNFDTRLMINDFAYKHRIPWIYGGVVQSTYVEAAFIPGETPCFNCMLPNIPAISLTCDTVGVIAPAVTMTTSFQLRDALKILAGVPFQAKLTFGDIWDMTHQVIGFSRMQETSCPTCGTEPSYPHLKEAKHHYATLCGRDTVQYHNPQLSVDTLVGYLEDKGIQYHTNGYLVRFKFESYRIVCFQDGRMLIHGLTDPNNAQTLIHKLFG